MQSPVHSPTPQQAARRKLVRGVFAAPAIMTVCTGSAFAAASNLQCITNQVNNNPTTVPVAAGLDTWLRVRLRQKGSAPVVYYVSGADIQIYKRTTNTVYLSSTQWQLFNLGTNTTSGGAIADPVGTSLSNSYAAVRFDAAGNVVGVGTGSTGTSALPGTCWNSIAPGL